MSAPDPLFDAKNNLYLGNWPSCLNECQKAKLTTDQQKTERDVFMYRAYMGQRRYGLILSEISDSAPPSLKAVKLLAGYLNASTTERETIVEKLEEDYSQYMSDPLAIYLIATIFYNAQNLNTALKLVHKSDDLECMALAVQIYLQLDRFDHAKKEHKRMAEINEYCTLTQLAMAWICIHVAGEKLQDAYFIFQELRDKYGSSAMLLNNLATCLIMQGRHNEADTLVQDAVEKDSNYSEAIVNQIILAQVSGKAPEVINRYINQLRDSPGAKSNAFLVDFDAKDREFDKIAVQYQA